jgi:hypothetical protein
MIDREGNAWRGADGEAGKRKKILQLTRAFFY